jgi:superfamily I DNA/RNA helicase
MARYKVVGPPGTGKTRRLLNEVHRYVKKGITLDQIGYFAFTRKAAGEARDRFLAKNEDLTKKDIKYFQTLHSLAFNNLGLKEENVMQEGNYLAIGESCGIQIKYATYETNNFNGIFSSNSEYLSLINLARVKQISAEEQFNLNEHLTWITKDKLIAIEKEINNYKKTFGLIDFTDMIAKFLDQNPLKLPKFKVIFVDEAQDLSLIQWAMIKKIEKDTDCDVWIAGDDDQAIFGWAGADVDSFIKWKSREILLDQSKRVPSLIQTKALDVINRIGYNRIPKNYLPKDIPGNIYQRYKLNDVDLTEGDWLILTRTKSLLKVIPPFLKRKGLYFNTAQGNSIGKTLYEDIINWEKIKKGEHIPEISYDRVMENIKSKEINFQGHWYDVFNNVPITKRDYMRAMLLNKENLSNEPRIKVSTIHGAKGGEATNVVLFLNQTANTIKGAKKSQAKQEEEFRVWYVGITRTMENLFLIKSKNKLKEFKI